MFMVFGFSDVPMTPTPILFIFGDTTYLQLVQERFQIIVKNKIVGNPEIFELNNSEHVGEDGGPKSPADPSNVFENLECGTNICEKTWNMFENIE